MRNINYVRLFAFASLAALSVSCQTQDTLSKPSGAMFSMQKEIVPFGDDLKKKWGAAVISDLDQDGWDDVITTEHGDHARIFWNDKGRFSSPDILINGDTHGMGVSDYNGDGIMDVVITVGGGNGANPKRPVHYTISPERKIEKFAVLDHFESTRGRTIKFFDADKDNALDLFYTGFAPKNVPELSTNDFYKNQNNEFVFQDSISVPADALSFKSITTDVNNDGNVDIIVFGGRDLTYSQGAPNGSFANLTADVFGDLASLRNINNIAQIDYDNDGDFDLFLSRAPYQFEREVYFDAEKKNLAFFAFNGPIEVDDFTIEGDNLVMENVQETYATFGVFVGKDRKQIEPKKHKGLLGKSIIITPDEAQGWPEGEKLEGLHISYLGNQTWRVGGYVNSRIAGVVKNVTSTPGETKRKPLPPRLLENRDGKFVDVTEDLGITISDQITQAAAGDFDNDGDMDLALIPYGNMVTPVKPFLLMNQNGQRFERASYSGLRSDEIGATGSSIVTIDYDQDGWLDLLFGNERGRWYLAKNELGSTSSGKAISVKVKPSPEARTQPIGARVDISACGVMQSQFVGASGDGFHHMLKDRLHFGIGDCPKADNVTVTWSNGETQSYENIRAGDMLQTAD